MRIVFLFQMLFFSLFLFGQTDSLLQSKPKNGAVYVSDYNVVYRGIRNPIDIVVPNAKSFTVSGIGVYHENGKYYISPGQGLEMKLYLEITLEDDTIVNEEYVFKIKNIEKIELKINGKRACNGEIKMTKNELQNAILSLEINNFPYDFFQMNILSYRVDFFDKRKSEIIEGNMITDELFNRIKKLKKGKKFLIYDTRQEFKDIKNNLLYTPLNSIYIEIID